MSGPPAATLNDTPIRSSLLLSLTTQSVLLNELFASLPSGGNDVPALHTSLVSSAAQLDNLSREAETHQANWAALLSQKAEVEALERKVRTLVRDLEKERIDLEAMVDEGRKIVKSMDKAETNPAEIPVLLAHAHALARTTSAPASVPGPWASTTPWPNEANMRGGLLFQLGGSMSGIGDIAVVGEETEQKPTQYEVVHEEPGRRYDPGAVFSLDLDSEGSDDE